MPEILGNTENDKRKHAEEIVHKLKQSGFEAYFVGGCVRDFVFGEIPGDYDIVTSALPDQIISFSPHRENRGEVRCCGRYY